MLKGYIDFWCVECSIKWNRIVLINSFDRYLFAFITGVCLTLLFSGLFEWPLMLIGLAFLLMLITRNKVFTVLFFIILGFGWASYQFNQHFYSSLPATIEGSTIEIQGQIHGLPSGDFQHTKFLFKVLNAYSDELLDVEELKEQNLQLSCYRCLHTFLPNQEWRLFVRLKRPHTYASWGAFDYEKYLFRKRIIATGYVRTKDQNIVLAEPKGIYLLNNRWRWQLRELLKNNLQDYPIGQGIISALMIGDKTLLTHSQKQVFQKTGVSHLMAISGLHIGLAFFVMSWFLKWALMPVAQIFNWQPRQKIILLPSFLFAFMYAALAGFAISTQRAMIMLLIYVLIKLMARNVSLFKVLLLTVSIIFIYDSFAILDAGFWLSCSAVLVISIMILQRETIESRQTNLLTQRELVNKVKRKSGFDLMKLQPILWLGMLPVTLLLFGKISLLSPFVNLIMVPLFSVLLIPLTLFALVLQLISLEMLSKNILVILSLVYEKIFYSLEWLSQHPLSQISLPPMQFWHWLLFITVAFFYFFNLKLKHILLGLWCVSLYFLSSLRDLDYEEFNVAVLDVGQGLSIVIEGPDYVLVYDTGASFQSGFNMADAVLMPYLHYRGIKKIDMLIVSHADNDHIGGFSVLNESFDIADILTSHVDDIPFANACQTDMAWSVGYLHFKILSPELNSSFDRNNNSCVLLVSNGDLKVLLTGDIEKVAEDDLVSKQGDLTADIMLAPHHGSKTSSSKSFIEAVSPQLALVSAGYRNRYGHPHEDVVQRYLEQDVNLKSTINSGSMLLNIKKNRWNLTEYRINEKGFWNRQKNTDNYKK